jgi:hypothetical protein
MTISESRTALERYLPLSLEEEPIPSLRCTLSTLPKVTRTRLEHRKEFTCFALQKNASEHPGVLERYSFLRVREGMRWLTCRKARRP